MRYLILLFPFLLSCQHQPRQGSHAFYYWKFGDEPISDGDTLLMKQLQVAHFYIHFDRYYHRYRDLAFKNPFPHACISRPAKVDFSQITAAYR